MKKTRTKAKPSSHRQTKKAKCASIVDYILAGEPWPDDLVETINDRNEATDRALDGE